MSAVSPEEIRSGLALYEQRRKAMYRISAKLQSACSSPVRTTMHPKSGPSSKKMWSTMFWSAALLQVKMALQTAMWLWHWAAYSITGLEVKI